MDISPHTYQIEEHLFDSAGARAAGLPPNWTREREAAEAAEAAEAVDAESSREAVEAAVARFTSESPDRYLIPPGETLYARIVVRSDDSGEFAEDNAELENK